MRRRDDRGMRWRSTGKPLTRHGRTWTQVVNQPTGDRSAHRRHLSAREDNGFRSAHPTYRRFAPLSLPPRLTCGKLTRRAEFRFRRRANHFYESRHPVPEEGALAIVTERWDGMRWTLRHRARDGIAGRDKLRERSWGAGRAVPKRTVKSCGPDASMVGVKSFGGAKARPGPSAVFREATGAGKPDTPG
jgi:hypothetical protein